MTWMFWEAVCKSGGNSCFFLLPPSCISSERPSSTEVSEPVRKGDKSQACLAMGNTNEVLMWGRGLM